MEIGLFNLSVEVKILKHFVMPPVFQQYTHHAVILKPISFDFLFFEKTLRILHKI